MRINNLKWQLPLLVAALLVSCNSIGERDNPLDGQQADATSSSDSGMGGSSQSSGSTKSSSSSSKRSSSGTVRYSGTTLTLDVVYRDFSVEFPDVEFFDADYPYLGLTAQCADDKANARDVPGALVICQDNQPCSCPADMVACSLSSVPTKTLEYGQRLCDGVETRGYIHELDAQGCTVAGSTGGGWFQDVYITYGMVKAELGYAVPVGDDSIDYAYPVSTGAGRCHNDNFAQWFQDVSGVNKHIDDHLQLTAIGGGYYEYNADWNSVTKGFFPLDQYDLDGIPDTTYGKQSLNIWCPASAKLYPEAYCSTWRANGGPQSPTAAAATVAQVPALSSLFHNYDYTMTMALRFQYNPNAENGAGETVTVHTNEAWFFVDGILVGDIGGAHIPAPLAINMNKVATARGGWASGSVHTLHMFYAHRHTPGAEFTLRTNLSGIL